jgi:hypothetical protein
LTINCITLLAFLRIKLACNEKTKYECSFSQAEFELHCPGAAAEFDRITNSLSGKAKSPSMGELGKWLCQLAHKKGMAATRAAKRLQKNS